MKRRDIAIIGAGPAGLAAALLLARDGNRPVIFERFDEPRPLGSGLMLQTTGLSVMETLGLRLAIVARGQRIEKLFGTDRSGTRTVLDVRYDALGKGRFGLGVHRAALFSVLWEAVQAQGIGVETGFQAEHVERSATDVRIVNGQGRASAAFDLVIDASGSRSRIGLAHQPGGRTLLDYGAIWASLPWIKGEFAENVLAQRYDKASVMAGILPIGRTTPAGEPMAALFWSLKPAAYAALQAKGLPEWQERVAAFWPPLAGYLAQIGGWEDMTLATYSHHTLRTPFAERLAFIGDAAHSASPQLGQGANMALLDAQALAVALRRYANLEQALAEYARLRRLHVRLFQALSAAFTPFYQSDSTILPFLRDRLVAPLSRVPPAPQFLAAMVSGTLGWGGLVG